LNAIRLDKGLAVT